MKKSLLLSAALVMTISATAVSPLMASTTNANNYSTVLSLLRSQQIDKLVNRVNQLQGYAQLYMFQTGDINPTAEKIKNYFHLPDSAIVNFTTGQLSLNADNSQFKYTIGNLFNSYPDSNLDNLLQHSSKLNSFAAVSSNGMSIAIPYTPKMIAYINTIKHLPSNAVVSTTAPDITKTWYQPTGSGNFNIMQYNNSTRQWENIGSLKKQGIVVNSAADLKNFSAAANVGTKAYVKNGGGLDTYVFDGTEWEKISVNNSKTLVDATNIPKCSINNKNQIIYAKEANSVEEKICDGSNWLDVTSGSGSNSNVTPVTIQAIFGSPNFDDAPQFKKIVNKNIPFCDIGNPKHCFKSWEDFLNQVDIYRVFSFKSTSYQWWYGWHSNSPFYSLTIIKDNNTLGKNAVYSIGNSFGLGELPSQYCYNSKVEKVSIPSSYEGSEIVGNTNIIQNCFGKVTNKTFQSFPGWENILENPTTDFFHIGYNWNYDLEIKINHSGFSNQDIQNIPNSLGYIIIDTDKYYGPTIWYVPKTRSYLNKNLYQTHYYSSLQKFYSQIKPEN